MDALMSGRWVEVGRLGVICMIEAIDAGLPGNLGGDIDAIGPPVGVAPPGSPSGLLLYNSGVKHFHQWTGSQRNPAKDHNRGHSQSCYLKTRIGIALLGPPAETVPRHSLFGRILYNLGAGHFHQWKETRRNFAENRKIVG